MDWFDFMQKYELLWIGSAEFVIERIEKLRSELNCQHVTIWPNPGLIPFKPVLKSIEKLPSGSYRILKRLPKPQTRQRSTPGSVWKGGRCWTGFRSPTTPRLSPPSGNIALVSILSGRELARKSHQRN